MNSPQHSTADNASSLGSSENEKQIADTDDVTDRKEFLTKSRWNPLHENSDTMQELTVAGVDDQNLVPEELSVEQLETCIQVILQSNTTVETENNLLESYLSDVDPTLIENMDKILEAATVAIHKAERTAQLATTLIHRGSRTGQESLSSSPRSTRQSFGSSSKVGVSSLLAERGLRVQPSQKIEIAQRESDKLKAGYEQLQTQAEKTIFNLECQREEAETRSKELEERKREFNHYLTKEWPDSTTHVVPGEKIINYFELKNKLDSSFIKGFPTKSKNMKIQLDACTSKIREIGEGLLYVDYEQLLIHYDNVRNNLSETMVKLTNHKRGNTTYVLMLTLTRDIIMKEENEKEKIREEANNLEKKIMRLLKNEQTILAEINKTMENIRKLEKDMTKFIAPPAFEYIEHKAHLHGMKKTLKATRRIVLPGFESNNIKKSVTKTSIGRRPRLYTGSSFWNPSDSIHESIKNKK